VAAVVLFHGFPTLLPGGFVGVDVFFVISGFLISTLVIDDLRRGSFSIPRFYARRVRRIFPALIVVLAALMVLGWWLMLSDEYQALGKHVVAGGGFASNLVHWRETGYFDVAADRKPLLHLWSLGIEEQFYLVWPALVWLAWRHGAVAHLVVAVLALSFALNVAAVTSYPWATFYLPMTRFWELMAGCGLALLARRAGFLGDSRPPSPRIAVGLSVGGALMLVASFALIDRETAFPGWWAALPVVATALLIAAGQHTWINRRLLAARPMVALGLISYPLYLWHYPLLSFLRLCRADATAISRITVVLLSVVLAAATYRFVEARIRHHPSPRTPHLLAAGLAVTMLVGALVHAGIVGNRSHPGDRVIVEASADWDYPQPTGELLGVPVRSVRQAESSASPTLWIGDSHIAQYYPRVKQLGSDSREIAPSIFVTQEGCPALPRVDTAARTCTDVVSRIDELVSRSGATTVVIGGSWAWYFASHSKFLVDVGSGSLSLATAAGRAAAFRLLQDALRPLRDRGIRLYVVLNVPMGNEFDPKRMVQRDLGGGIRLHHADLDRAAFERAQEHVTAELRQVAAGVSATVIDPVEHLCEPTVCRTTQDGIRPVYKDYSHLRASYARENVTFLDSAVATR
jgi:peptidoglycan/LPS O-acetylase OafA/YrhL